VSSHELVTVGDAQTGTEAKDGRFLFAADVWTHRNFARVQKLSICCDHSCRLLTAEVVGPAGDDVWFAVYTDVAALTPTEFSATKDAVFYRITVQTSDARHSGTTSDTFIQLIGKTRGRTGPIPLLAVERLPTPCQHPSPFSRGSLDVFRIVLPELGDIASLDIWRGQGDGNKADWRVSGVGIEHESRMFVWSWYGPGHV
jgi:hypothetical protein